MNPKVDGYIARNPRWQVELRELRRIVLQTGLTETLKWGVPCYADDSTNVVLLHVFKAYCAILFVQGALLADRGQILVTQTENVQAARQVRFVSVQDVLDKEALLSAYVAEAIALHRSGAKVAFKPTEQFAVCAEFQAALDGDPALQTAFAALTPGRQRAYLLFFGGAKQAKTRQARIDKSRAQILAGKGLDDA